MAESLIDTKYDHRRNLPKTEMGFEEFLISNGVQAARQFPVLGCPFVKNKAGKHEADYRIQNAKGDELFIEVKGSLTYFEVNKLLFLTEVYKRPFYILEVTNEDWMGACGNERGATGKKIAGVTLQQYEEIRQFWMGNKSAQEMNDLASTRLHQYIEVRNNDLKVWTDKYRQYEGA